MLNLDIEAKAREMTAEQLQPMVNALLPALVNMHREVTDWREHLSKGS